MLFAIICVSQKLVGKLYKAFLHLHSIKNSVLNLFRIAASFCPAPDSCCVSSHSSYWSHAGLYSPGREESGFAAQLPPRFSQVRFNSHHTTRDCMSCLAESKMSCYVHIHISAARLVAYPQNVSHEIDFPL